MSSKSRKTTESTAAGGQNVADALPNETGRFDRVLVAVDGETDDAVGSVAVSEALRHDARVDALSVVRMNASVDRWDMVVERREASAEAALDAIGDAATETDVSVEKRLRYGDPSGEIVRYASHNDIDLIVLGEPTRTGLRRYISSTSVTERVRRSAPVPVLTVPGEN
ncbi:universal stress protein UspA [Natrinema sp. CBA1119]|uniref:universal stress protein n=1 Tax=Natrinema sp. CBA1119 TaxID=1608465 RepID=UPI000BF4988B|nr:universal stress protein [Natrinema sp. CBA1119]PGF18064.1 universal stress protein UspA [Natrinema sp. CBA1119]